MKFLFTIFGFMILHVVRSTNHLSIKQNLSHAWFPEPHTLDKLILKLFH